MINNDILIQVCDILDIDKAALIDVFAHYDVTVSAEQIDQWVAGEPLTDVELAAFLNGLIIEKRGQKDGDKAPLETELTNNMVFRKLMIALNLKADDTLEILEEAGWVLGKRELGAYFRNANNAHYRPCKDEVLAGFISGLELLMKK